MRSGIDTHDQFLPDQTNTYKYVPPKINWKKVLSKEITQY